MTTDHHHIAEHNQPKNVKTSDERARLHKRFASQEYVDLNQSLDKRLGPLTIGTVLRSWRLCDELTLKAFGKRIGLSAANLSDIEQGRKGISVKRAHHIAKKLKLPSALFVQLALQAQLKEAGLRYTVELKPAA